MEMFQEYLTAPSVEGKVQQLIAFLVQQPADQIDNSFDFKAHDQDRAEYFDTMIAEALTSFFEVPTEPSDIEPLSTVQDVVNRVNSGNA
ncbi:Acyl carrier protein [Caenorhabditis elegans]|uniref:Acyl carrier protein n=1 Tax=Caenorhabditis elegans TaxID=6239 RepID=O17685_CAEEL|nr:Acyl carrier protein [Caenorhabditis elegans]CAB03980.2 Acyl carrier protein [Caenorhabditis elegans]|eukprot:NP_510008.2 Uncharacterized protein CELE_C49F5.7 [Caenorhabditis elegans]